MEMLWKVEPRGHTQGRSRGLHGGRPDGPIDPMGSARGSGRGMEMESCSGVAAPRARIRDRASSTMFIFFPLFYFLSSFLLLYFFLRGGEEAEREQGLSD